MIDEGGYFAAIIKGLILIPQNLLLGFAQSQKPRAEGGEREIVEEVKRGAVRFLLACQPCNCYLLPVNGFSLSLLFSTNFFYFLLIG